MEPKDGFTRMFQILKEHNVYSTHQFNKDICSLVKTDVDKFIEKFTKDFMRASLKDYKRYERLKTTKSQNQRLNGNALFRYEYRNNSNLRCIYIIHNVNNTNETILLNAFNEDKSKTINKNSYSFNIERAINTYISILKK